MAPSCDSIVIERAIFVEDMYTAGYDDSSGSGLIWSNSGHDQLGHFLPT
jgi:hypothetical protein